MIVVWLRDEGSPVEIIDGDKFFVDNGNLVVINSFAQHIAVFPPGRWDYARKVRR